MRTVLRRPALLALLAVALWVAASAPAAAQASRPCRSGVGFGAVPPWATDGFSKPDAGIPHALGRSGRIVGIVFGYPLRAPALSWRANKILWVTRVPVDGPGALVIRAQRMAGARPVGKPVRRVLEEGPGPSIVDLPQAGCWRLALRWRGGTDVLDIAYGARS
jgi:hypothetical protein